MADSPVSEPRAKRQKQDKHGRFAALQKLKGLKGLKNKYEVDDVDNIYDDVDEKEYVKRVVDKNEDWIVDDGSGYFEDGRDIFDDDLDSASISEASKNKGGTSSKKKKKAVSDHSAKGNLQYMLSNMPSKKKEDVKLGEDDLLSELISELDSGGSDKMKKTATPSRKSITLKSTPGASVFAEKQAAKNYMKSFSVPKNVSTVKPVPLNNTPELTHDSSTMNNTNVLKEIQNIPETDIPQDEIKMEIEPIETNENICKDSTETKKLFEIKTEDIAVQQEVADIDSINFFDDEFDLSQVVDEEEEKIEKKNLITEEQLLNGWEKMQEGAMNETQANIEIDTSELPLITNDDGKEVLRFFWWDAYETPSKPGTVFLFGKIFNKASNSYVSCCLTVKNIKRRVFFLPRDKHLQKNAFGIEEPVTMWDVYNEINTEVLKKMHLQEHKTRKITKKYCFDPNIPLESDYFELLYSADYPPIDENLTGKTFSKVFGTNSSFLEMFLLDQKIKGPCWLDISYPEPVANPITWCKFEVSCSSSSYIKVTNTLKHIHPPPLVVASINLKTVINPTLLKSEIVMISCLVQNNYLLNKSTPQPLFQQHFCVISKPKDQVLPLNIHEALRKYKATKVQKMDSEKGLLNYFLNQFEKIDPDLIVGHDLQDYQINILSERLATCQVTSWSRLSRIKRNVMPTSKFKAERELFIGRLVCDMKISAKELIKSRSYDLISLCQTVLKVPEDKLIEVEPEEVSRMYQNSIDILKLVMLTMQYNAYILQMMYDLNVIPLALQITNIAGNIMSRTLLGGRSERNEFLLLHAFTEKDYIVPDKARFKKKDNQAAGRKKPTYAGGLVLDPKVGFYDKLVLLMDFNSLYPSIIQEYNICFTTVDNKDDLENISLPDSNLAVGILPTEIRKLVESRKGVKTLMKTPDLTPDLYMQYHIRQMALKLTANSMYGCLGFANSRFYAKKLAALVTQKGREILMNTKDIVQKMCYEVIYGDTDSIMINTNILDYEQVFRIGNKIKQEVNRLYRQVELDVDGVFKYLLLLKKKKYASVTLSKGKNGALIENTEFKGLDIVRRDWSRLAVEAGSEILKDILSDQSPDERIENILNKLAKIKTDLEENKVPQSLLEITKQLTKDPKLYTDKNQPHVLVAERYNKRGGKQLRGGDTVHYVICDDGTSASAMQRAYHIDELKNSETLKIDNRYYLNQQIYPVVSRLCEPIEGIDAYQIALSLGMDTSSIRKPKEETNELQENIRNPEVRYRNCLPFTFQCDFCQVDNIVTSPLRNGLPFLLKCTNTHCTGKPIDYLNKICNQLSNTIRSLCYKYNKHEMTCEDPACLNDDADTIPFRFVGKYPVCTVCQKGVMYEKYTETEVYRQITYFEYIFDLSKLQNKPLMEESVENGYSTLKQLVTKTINKCAYGRVSLSHLFLFLNNEKEALQTALISTNLSKTNSAQPFSQRTNVYDPISDSEDEDVIL